MPNALGQSTARRSDRDLDEHEKGVTKEVRNNNVKHCPALIVVGFESENTSKWSQQLDKECLL